MSLLNSWFFVFFKIGMLFVEWDIGFKLDYRFGIKSKFNNKYDV